MTEETLQRLTRLATPRACTSSTEESKKPPPHEGKHTFSPRIGALWRKEDWESLLCKHQVASARELESWFPQLSETPKGKKRDAIMVKAMRSIRNCPHASLEDATTVVCKACRTRLCKDCLTQTCRQRKCAFLQRSEEEQLEALQEELDVCAWEARALLRSSTPVVERLTVDRARRARRQEEEASPEDARPTTWWSDQQRSARTTEAFERLTTPREAKPFADIPYLPEMARSVPAASQLGLEGLASEPLEHALYKLRSEHKINALQAGVLLRCATPVFDRLYENKPGSKYRHATDDEQV